MGRISTYLIIFVALFSTSAFATCSNQASIEIGDSLFATLCPQNSPVMGLGTADPLSRYYGFIVATTDTSQATLENQKESIGDFIESIFSTRTYTANVSLVITLHTVQGDVILPERPLFTIQRKHGGGTEIAGSNAALLKTPISPYFALMPASSGADVTFKVTLTNDTTVNIASFFKTALDFATAAGVQGAVISTLSKPVISDAVNKSQSFISGYFSSSESSSATGYFTFVSGGAHSLDFSSVFRNGGDRGLVNVTVAIAVRPSLISDKVEGTAQIVPIMTGPQAPPPGSWAAKIQVADKNTLQSAISGDGVPRKLSALDPSNSLPQPTAAQNVEVACEDLSAALRGGKYFSLDDIDADLVLFDQLNMANVFADYTSDQVPCYGKMLDTWHDRYGLAPHNDSVVDWPSMKKRLTKLGGDWKQPSPAAMNALIPEDFDNPVQLTVDSTILSADIWAALSPISDGLGIGSLNPSVLLAKPFTCFGGFKQTDGHRATALGQMSKSTTVYAFTVLFDGTASWDPRYGPPIKAIAIRPATPADQPDKLDCKDS